MKRSIAVGVLAIGLAWPALAALNPGDVAPDFNAQASLAGQTFSFSLKESFKRGPVVVYFYPSAYTSGCNLQARSFAENHDKFTAAGASVVGVSLDSIERLNTFSADPEFCGGKVAVASDPQGAIARAYDLDVRDAREGIKDTRGERIDHGFAERTTFVVSPDGRIAATHAGLSPVANVEKALETVQHLAAERAAGRRP